ncbi:hypothetical protein, partial [Frankia sp. Cr1]|uniref:hypothetical protein n=1 Tax=Frankia sp. Cr1 TaxID=3073931 RepID=UPI002AD4D58F
VEAAARHRTAELTSIHSPAHRPAHRPARRPGHQRVRVSAERGWAQRPEHPLLSSTLDGV